MKSAAPMPLTTEGQAMVSSVRPPLLSPPPYKAPPFSSNDLERCSRSKVATQGQNGELNGRECLHSYDGPREYLLLSTYGPRGEATSTQSVLRFQTVGTSRLTLTDPGQRRPRAPCVQPQGSSPTRSVACLLVALLVTPRAPAVRMRANST